MKQSKNNTMYVVLVLLVVSSLLIYAILTKQAYLDIFYLSMVDFCFGRYYYQKKKS